LQIRPGLHNHDLWFSGYFLHSCNPNIRLDMEAMKVFAVRDIAANDWLYMDYSDTEDELFCCFPCQCGAATCRGFITGRQQQGRPNDDAACPHMDGSDATGSSGNVSPMLVDSIASGEMQSVTKEASVPAVQATGRWWARADLCYQGANLTFACQDVGSLARQHGTPSFFYNGQRIVDNVQRLKGALAEAGFAQRSRVLYAMKANRFAPLLTFLRTTKVLGGIDCCSPNEVEHAIACGFRAEDISFTNTSLSRRDLERLSAIDGLMMNCDSLHSIRRWGELGRGREIGIRINPALGTGRADNNKLQYCGVTISKFGIYKEQLAEAIALAAEYDLTITRVHFHTGCGLVLRSALHVRPILARRLTCLPRIFFPATSLPKTLVKIAADSPRTPACTHMLYLTILAFFSAEPRAGISHRSSRRGMQSCRNASPSLTRLTRLRPSTWGAALASRTYLVTCIYTLPPGLSKQPGYRDALAHR